MGYKPQENPRFSWWFFTTYLKNMRKSNWLMKPQNFPGENKNSLKPPSSKWPKLRLLHCFIIHPQKTQKSYAFWWCFLVFSCVWQVLCSCLGVRKNGGRIFLVLLQMTNGSFFQLSSMAKGYKSIHWKSWGVLDVVELSKVAVGRCWKLSGIQKQRDFPTSKGAHMPYKVPTSQ